MQEHVIQEATIAQVAVKAGAVTSTASGASGLLGLTHAEWSSIGVLSGIVIGVIGLVLQYYFKAKQMKAEAEWRAQLSVRKP